MASERRATSTAGMHGPYGLRPRIDTCALSGSSDCIQPLMIPRLTEFKPTTFCSVMTYMPCLDNSANCPSVGPCQRPTKVLTPIVRYFGARAGDCSQTPTGKKPPSDG